MKLFSKRLLTMLLAAAMVFSLSGMTTFAAETDDSETTDVSAEADVISEAEESTEEVSEPEAASEEEPDPEIAVLSADDEIATIDDEETADDAAYSSAYTWYTNNPDADTFTITTAEDLAGLSDIVNGTDSEGIGPYSFQGKTVQLGGNIQMNADEDVQWSNGTEGGTATPTINAANATAFTPIGNMTFNTDGSVKSGNAFEGTFDGQGYEIQNLYVTGADGYVGLFGVVGNATTPVSAVVENVTITGVIECTGGSANNEKDFVGAACAKLNAGATVNKVINKALVYAPYTDNVGGIVGFAGTPAAIDGTDTTNPAYSGNPSGYNTFVTCCGNEATVLGYHKIGGIVGENAATVKYCYNNGWILCRRNSRGVATGGIVGSNGNNYTPVEESVIAYCYNAGTITNNGCDDANASASATRPGVRGYAGITGANYGGAGKNEVYNCYNIGAIPAGYEDYNSIASNLDAGGGAFAAIRNNYSLNDPDTIHNMGTDEQEIGIPVSADNFKVTTRGEGDILTNLGVYFEADTTGQVNNYYPILFWQAGDEEPELTDLEITTPPTKVAYDPGDTFDPTGMVVTATYKSGDTTITTQISEAGATYNGTWYDLTGGYTVTRDPLEDGTDSVTITFTDGDVTKTATQPITVGSTAPTVSDVTITATGLDEENAKTYNEEGVDLTVSATVTPDDATKTYQWYTVDASGNATEIGGATNETYTTGSNVSDSGTYRCTVTATDSGKETSASGDITITINPAAQVISYADSTVTKDVGEKPFTITLDEETVYPADGSGISYASDTESVATVDATSGEVTLVAVGSATITATAAATDNYAEATASYELTVNDHSWGEATWEWTETEIEPKDVTDHLPDYTATASRTCTVCGEEETVDATAVTKDTTATATAAGTTTYTATATFEGETEAVTGTKEVNTYAIAPDGSISIVYNGDTTALSNDTIDKAIAAAEISSKTNSRGTTVTTKYVDITDLVDNLLGIKADDYCSFTVTCSDDEEGESFTGMPKDAALYWRTDKGCYRTAVDGKGGSYWRDDPVTIEVSTEHAWGDAEWTWTETESTDPADHLPVYTATATRTCTICGEEETATAEVTKDTTATATAAGTTTYTATATFEGETEAVTGTKEVETDAIAPDGSISIIYNGDTTALSNETIDAAIKAVEPSEKENANGTKVTAQFVQISDLVDELLEITEDDYCNFTVTCSDSTSPFTDMPKAASLYWRTDKGCYRTAVDGARGSYWRDDPVTIEVVAHTWGNVEWTWTETEPDDPTDHLPVYTATATRTCSVCGAEETATATVTKDTTATATQAGTTTYTATATFKGETDPVTATQTENTAAIAPNGSISIVYDGVTTPLSNDTIDEAIKAATPSEKENANGTKVTAQYVEISDLVNTLLDITADDYCSFTVTCSDSESPFTGMTKEAFLYWRTDKACYRTAVDGGRGNTWRDDPVKIELADHTWGTVTWDWADDFSSATASRTCTTCGEIETANATITSEVTKEPRATEPGETTYTAMATFEGDTEAVTDTKTAEIDPLDPDGYITFVHGDDTWTISNADLDAAIDAAPATTIHYRSHNQENTLTKQFVLISSLTNITDFCSYTVDAKDGDHEPDMPTDTYLYWRDDDGGYFRTAVDGGYGYQFVDSPTTITIVDHTWDNTDITWTWADDDSSATATRKCSVCGAEDTVDAVITSETTKEPRATEPGEATYTATATFSDGTVVTDEKEGEIAPLDPTGSITFVHGDDTWTISNVDLDAAIDAAPTQTFTYHSHGSENTLEKQFVLISDLTKIEDFCSYTIDAKDGDHQEGMPTDTYLYWRDGENGGYFRTAVNGGQGYQWIDAPTTITIIDHDWNVTWDWAEDYSSATATRTCSLCEATETVTATVTSQTTPPTTEADGQTVYTATATFSDGTTATDTKTVVIPKLIAPTVSDVTITSNIKDNTKAYDGAGVNLTVSATVTPDTAEVAYQWYTVDASGKATAIDGATSSVYTTGSNVSDSGTYQCEVTATNDGLTATDTASIEITITQAAQDISYKATVVTKNDDDENFTNPLTETTVYGAITYTSSDESVATVDATSGEVTIKGAGTATITATAAAGDNYMEGTASYILTVNVSGFDWEIDVNGEKATWDADMGEYTDNVTYTGDPMELKVVITETPQEQGEVDKTTYQWYRFDPEVSGLIEIDGATDDTYTLKDEEVYAGDFVYVCIASVTYKNGITHTLYCTIEITIEKAEQVISYETQSIDKTVGDEPFTNTLTETTVDTEGGAVITYASSDESIATVDATTGEVTILTDGTVTITATVSETTNYAEATASYTITIAANKTALQEEYDEDSKLSEDDYTPDSWAPFEAAMESAKAVLDNDKATQQEVDDALAALQDAKAGLVEKVAPTVSVTVTSNATDNTKAYDGAGINLTATATVTPDTAEITSYQWYTVDESGTATAIEGATSSVYTTGSNVSDSGTYRCEVTATNDGLTTTESGDITITITPAAQELSYAKGVVTKYDSDPAFTNPLTETVVYGAITYTSSEESVATVNENTGEVTIVAAGTTTITATAAAGDNYTEASASYILTVNVSGIEWQIDVNNDEATWNADMGEYTYEQTYDGEPLTLKVAITATPDVEGDVSGYAYQWCYFDPEVMGLINIPDATDDTYVLPEEEVNSGDFIYTCIVTVNYVNGHSHTAYCTIEITINKIAQEISYATTEVEKKVGDDPFTNELTVGVLSTESGAGISYKSSDDSIATVDETTGEVTILKNGTVTITATAAATANYEEATASYTLTIATDKDALQAEYDADKDLNEDDYTAASWAPFEEALTNAKTVLDNYEATQKEIDDALAALQDAKAGLVEKVPPTVSVTVTSTLEGGTKDYDGIGVSLTATVMYTPDTAEVSCQWYKDGEAIDGATYSVLNIDGNVADSGTYKCEVTATNDGLTATADAEITITINAAAQDISYAETTLEKTYGDEPFTNELTRTKVSTDEGAGITYASSDETIATVDENGMVTILDAGTVTITATAAATPNFTEATASYTVTIATNKDALQAEYDADSQLNEDDYTPITWAPFEEALANAKDVLDNDEATQKEINDALAALESAREDLTEKADKTALEAAITAAGLLDEDEYTADSWAAMEEALAAAQAVDADENASQDAADQAAVDLVTAIAKLTPISSVVDKSDLLNEVLEDVLLSESDYTEASWAPFETALSDAVSVLADPEATQDDVDDALLALQTAKDNLEPEPAPAPAVDKEGLEVAIEIAEALNESDYTPESWAVLEEELADAKAVDADPNATQDDVDNAVGYVLAAIAQLEPVEKPDKTDLLDEYTEAMGLNESDYTPDTWEALEQALADAQSVLTNPNATADEVEAAEEALKTAMDNLEPAAVKEGLLKDSDGVWRLYKDNVFQKDYTGFAENDNGKWYVEFGVVTFAVSDILKDKNGAIGTAGDWYYVIDSKVQDDFTGLSNLGNQYGWWYIVNGKVDFTRNSVDKNVNGWWYVVGGKVQFGFTGLANYKNEYGWWYIQNGKVNFNHDGVDKNKNGWWYVTGSKVQFDFTGLANFQNEYGWWYIESGKVNFDHNGVEKNVNGWWYVKDSKVQFSFDGIATNQYGTWYITGGKVDFDFNGTVTVGGTRYTVRGGRVS